MQNFFNYQGLAPAYSHVGEYVSCDRLVIPKRHPYKCYESHAQKENFDLARFVGWWHELIFRSKTAFMFPIEEKDEGVEKAACKFVGVPYIEGFPWIRIGASDIDRGSKLHLRVVDELQFAVDWFNG